MSLVSTINTYIYHTEVTPGSGSYAANLTFTTNADVVAGTMTALGVGVNISGAEVVNLGELQSRGAAYTVLLDSYTKFYNFGIIKNNGLDAAAGGYVYNYKAISGLGTAGVGDNAIVMTSGTIVNAGIINASNDGVLLTSGRILNADVIEGAVDGIKLAGYANIRNNFEIYGGLAGIELENGGHVSNGVLIAGETYGVLLDKGGFVGTADYISGGKDAILNKSGALTVNLYPAEHKFGGGVVDDAGTGVLNLMGGGTGAFDMGGSVSGFSAINFQPGSTWTLEGTAGELAGGETIGGFTAGEAIKLDGFGATGDKYVAGVGLELFSASSTLVLDVTGTLVTQNFIVSNDMTATSISFVAGTVLPSGTSTVPSGVSLTAPIIGTTSSAYAQTGSTLTNPVISGGTLEIGPGVSVNGEIYFTGDTGKLILDGTAGGAAGFAPTITGFAYGDSIEFTNSIFDANDTVSVPAPGVVDIDADGTHYYLHLDDAYVGETYFSLVSDPNFVTLVDTQCFCAGTRILTTEGEVPVEDLRVGDTVITVREHGPLTQKIIWTGSQHVQLARHPEPERLRPIRIRAGALAHNIPERDLRLSPHHAVYLNGYLFEAISLLNGTTIIQTETNQNLTYYHFEVESHDVILAEGAACETYLDTGSRHMFGNMLHAEFRSPPDAKFCVPLIRDGEALAQVRREINARAERFREAA